MRCVQSTNDIISNYNNMCVVNENTEIPEDITILTSSNRIRGVFNELAFKKYLENFGLPEEEISTDNLPYLQILADVHIKGFNYDEQKTLEKTKNYFRGLDSRELRKIDGILNVFVGAPLMITVNSDILQGIANGISCHLVKFFLKDPSKVTYKDMYGVKVPVTLASNVKGLLMYHDEAGLQSRNFIEGLPGHFLVTNKRRYLSTKPISKFGKFKTSIVGFENTLSFAITGHKSQGTTLKNILIADVGNHASGSTGWLYVVLSRVHDYKNIYLVDPLIDILKKYKNRKDIKKFNTYLENLAKGTMGRYLELKKLM